MADPKQDAADRLSLERAIGEVIAYQNKLLAEQDNQSYLRLLDTLR